jgi:hypothetical protein
MAALDFLARDVAAGLLTGEQATRYHQLQRKLKEALRLIDTLGLGRPRICLDA